MGLYCSAALLKLSLEIGLPDFQYRIEVFLVRRRAALFLFCRE